MWELDHKESWVPKNWWFQTVVLEKTLESPLDCKEIKLVIGRTDGEAEAPIFDHLMQRDDSLEKTLILGKIKGKRRSGQLLITLILQRMELNCWKGWAIGFTYRYLNADCFSLKQYICCLVKLVPCLDEWTKVKKHQDQVPVSGVTVVQTLAHEHYPQCTWLHINTALGSLPTLKR